MKLGVVLPISQSTLSLCVGIGIPMLRRSVVGAVCCANLPNSQVLSPSNPTTFTSGVGSVFSTPETLSGTTPGKVALKSCSSPVAG